MDEVAKVLRDGGAVVLPTDTVYGVAVRADRPGAVDALAALKDRAAEQPVAVLVASLRQAEVVGELPGWARPIAERWWPGPLTLVLRRREGLGWDLGEPAFPLALIETVQAERTFTARCRPQRCAAV